MNAPQDWDPRVCNDRSGFLFQHDCGSLPEHHCIQCGKPVCDQHTHHVDNEVHCTVCAKQDLKQRRQESQTRRRDSDDDYDDPYFYGDHHYDGYGRYRRGYWGYASYSTYGHGHEDHDFTAGDAESVLHEGDGDFESDMSES